jgi:uncharacterized membrane protein
MKGAVMTKQQFLAELARELQRIPESERRDILRDYEEYFIDAAQAGRSDTEVITTLGNPTQIAQQLIADRHVKPVTHPSTLWSKLKYAVALVCLITVNVVILLGPLLAVATAAIYVWGFSIALAVAPIVYLSVLRFDMPIYDSLSIYALMQAIPMPLHLQGILLRVGGFASLVIGGIGILICITLFYFTRWCIRLIKKYLDANVTLIRGSTQ